MGELALVGVPLRHSRQLLVPLHLLHVRGGRLRARLAPPLLPVGQLGPVLVVHAHDLGLLRGGQAAPQHLGTLGAVSLGIAHGVLPRYDAVVGVAVPVPRKDQRLPATELRPRGPENDDHDEEAE